MLGLDGAHYAISSHADTFVGKATTANYRKRSKSSRGAPTSYATATIAVPLGFFSKEEIANTRSLRGVDEKHFPYLRFRATVLRKGHGVAKNMQSVRFEVDGDTTVIDTKTVHTYLCANSPFLPPLDVPHFLSLSDDEWDGGGNEEDGIDGEIPKPAKRKGRRAANRGVATYASEPAYREETLEHVAKVHKGWQPAEHVEKDDITHHQASDARCAVCASQPEALTNDFQWCSGQFPAGRGPEYECHRALVCPSCAGNSATQDQVLASLGITHGLQQATLLWMRKNSLVLSAEESTKWNAAFKNLEALFSAPAGPVMVTQAGDWAKPASSCAAKVARAEYFFQRVMNDQTDLIAVILFASWRFEAIDAAVTARGGADDDDAAQLLWYREEEKAGALALLKKVKLKCAEARRIYVTQVYLCPGCSTSEPTSEDIWGPLFGPGAFLPMDSAPNVRAPLGAPCLPPSMAPESEAWRFGSFNPQVEIDSRREVRVACVKALLTRKKRPSHPGAR
jgi:hypothetical protein